MNLLHTVSAVIELGAGLGLLGFPSATVALLVGAPIEGPAVLRIVAGIAARRL